MQEYWTFKSFIQKNQSLNENCFSQQQKTPALYIRYIIVIGHLVSQSIITSSVIKNHILAKILKSSSKNDSRQRAAG